MITLYNILELFKKGELYSDTPVYSKEGKLRMLTSDVIIKLSNNQILVIGRGFMWDENSIPWILQPLFPKSGIYAASALVHDALYYLTVHERSWVDKEYLKWMIATGVNVKQSILRFWAVGLFGGRWWHKNESHTSKLCQYNRSVLTLH